MKTLFIFYALLFYVQSIAQTERIDTDRPDQTESAFLVPKKYFQGEFGFGKESLRDRNYNLDHPAFLLKYGLSNRFELRVEGDFLSQYVHLSPDTKSSVNLEPVEIGSKIALFEEKGLLPKTSLIVHAGLPFAASSYDKQQNLFPSFRFTCSHTIAENIGLGYNLGADWDGYEKSPAWLYTFSPNLTFGKRWYVYVEAFGFYERRNWENVLDGGLAFYLDNDSKLDLSGGIGLGSSLLKNYFSLGFSFRLH